MNPALWGLVSALSWGTADFLARLAGRRIGAVTTTLGMLASSTLLLTLWIGLTRPPLVWDLEAAPFVLIAGVAIMLATLLFYAALARGPVAVASPLIASFPAFVVVGALFLGIVPAPIQWFAIAVTMLGVWIVCHPPAAGGAARGGESVRPTVLLGLLSAVCFAVAVLAAREAVLTLGQLQTVWLGRIVSLATIVPYVVLTGARMGAPWAWWPVIVIMGILDTAANLALLYGAVGRGAPVAAVASSAFAVVTVVLAWRFLSERIRPRRWVGIGLVVAGAALLAYVGEAPTG